jgi:Co/Zn/Cd efflux system component
MTAYGTLRIVLAINAVMFVVEFTAGLLSRSTALLADSLDNLGDATTYGLSLCAVARGARAKAKIALFKSALILAAALFVIGQVGYSIARPGMPVFEAKQLLFGSVVNRQGSILSNLLF